MGIGIVELKPRGSESLWGCATVSLHCIPSNTLAHGFPLPGSKLLTRVTLEFEPINKSLLLVTRPCEERRYRRSEILYWIVRIFIPNPVVLVF